MSKHSWYNALEYSLVAIVFIFLGIFSYAQLFAVPYIGFQYNGSTGEVTKVFINRIQEQALRPGDRILQAGNNSLEEFQEDLRQVLIPPEEAGKSIFITILREGETQNLLWYYPGFTLEEFVNRAIWFPLPFLMFAAGLATMILVRPRDIRWKLLLAFDFLNALWLAAAMVSWSHVWSSAVWMRAILWLCLPVFLHLHWEFPRSMGKLPAQYVLAVYLINSGLAAAEWYQVLPGQTIFIGLTVMLGGSLVLLAVHWAARREQRGEMGLLLVAVTLVFIPLLAVVITALTNQIAEFPGVFAFVLPILPAAYFFVIYRRQMGGLEIRANRAIILFLYGIVLFSIALIFIPVLQLFLKDTGAILFAGIASFTLVGLISSVAYPAFVHWVERSILGMTISPRTLFETYSSQITTSLEIEQLVSLLRNEVFPAFFIRQAALLRLDNAQKPFELFSLGIEETDLPRPEEIPLLLAQAGQTRQPRREYEPAPPCAWVHLALALSVEGRSIGLCLLGRRDPDDYYAINDVNDLQTLMNQTALALVNIEQAEHLRALYQANIERQEAERHSLARELHDDVLGQMAILAMSAGEAGLGTNSQFDLSYQSATAHIRDIIGGLRPTMLSYGLRAAIEELADEIIAQTAELCQVEVNLPASETRYHPDIELHVYRILQQACQNSVTHGKSTLITVYGQLTASELDILVSDNGVGFKINERLDLAKLLADKHFGLVGMHERAALIGAQLRIESTPGKGTRVRVSWSNNHH